MRTIAGLLIFLAFSGCVTSEPEINETVAPSKLMLTATLEEDTVNVLAEFDDGFTPSIVSWEWGDGTSSKGNPASHTYVSTGSFAIRATALRLDGSSQQAEHEILLVSPNEPEPVKQPPATSSASESSSSSSEEDSENATEEPAPENGFPLFLISPSPSRPGELVTVSSSSNETYLWQTEGFGDQRAEEATYRFPEGERWIQATNETSTASIGHIVEGEPVEQWYRNFDGEPEDCSKLANPGPFTIDDGLVTGFEMVELDVVILVDTSFVRAHGENWRDSVDFIIEYGDQVYQEQLQLDIVLVDVFEIPASYMDVSDTDTAGLGSDESQAVLDISRQYMDDFHPYLHRDLVYTLVGASIAGTIAGQAECIGGAGYKDAAYGWGEADDINDGNLVGPVGWFSYSEIKVILHEMGHILGAHHHYQYCGPPLVTSLPGDVFGGCSLMTNAVDFASFEISPQNKAAIRGWVEESGI